MRKPGTVQERGDRIVATHHVRLQALLREAQSLVVPVGSFPMRARRMVWVTDQFARLVAPEAVCRKRCAHCCHLSTTISSWEAEQIAAATGRKAADPPGVDLASDHDAERMRYAGIACTFLRGDECSIYAARPMACRTHFQLGDDPARCDVKANPGAQVENFNFQPLWFQQVALFHGGGHKFADIREFFPPETTEAA